MHPAIKCTAILAVLIGGWYGVWHQRMAAHVARVEKSIDYQESRFKTASQYVSLRADSVSASGFPFASRVRVARPTFSVIFNGQTYAVSTAEMLLTPSNAQEARYRVEFPAPIEAIYAVDGASPENYRVTFSPMPQIALRAQGDSTSCPIQTGGMPCATPPVDAPLISFALGLPASITMHVEKAGESRDVPFQLIPVPVPVFALIPKDAHHTVELFVDVLREALVFKTPHDPEN